MKLSKAQQHVIDTMRNGAALRRTSGITPRIILVGGGLYERVNYNTFVAILSSGLIIETENSYPFITYKLKSQLSDYQLRILDIRTILNENMDKKDAAVALIKYFRDNVVSNLVMEECIEAYNKSAQLPHYCDKLARLGMEEPQTPDSPYYLNPKNVSK